MLTARELVDATGTIPGTLGEFGELFIHRLDEDTEGSCRIALGIFRPDLWSQGLGSDALDTACAWALSEGGRSTVFLRVLEYNTRAIRCYERAGFRECWREASDVSRSGGGHYSDIVMSLARRHSPERDS